MTTDLEIAEAYTTMWMRLRASLEAKVAKAEARRTEQEGRRVLPLGTSIEINVTKDVLRMMYALDEANMAGVLGPPV